MEVSAKFRGLSEAEKERDNADRFLDAARAIYDRLLPMVKGHGAAPIAWDETEPTVVVLLSEQGAESGWNADLAVRWEKDRLP